MLRTTYRVVLWVATLCFVCLGTYPAHTQTRPTLAAAEPAAFLPAEPAWTVTLPDPPSAPGAMDGHRVYIPLGAGGARIVALDREDGKTIWTRDVETLLTPAVSHGVVIVAASDEVHALDAATGDHRWRVGVVRPVAAAPAIAGSLAIVPIAPDGVLALRLTDGSIAWQQSFSGPAGPVAMTASGDALYFSLPPSRVVRVSATDGRLIWDRTLSGTLGPPGIGHDRVFVGSRDNVLFALDVRDGSVEWKYPAGGDVVGAAGDRDLVFMVALDNVLRALKRSNGNQVWKVSLPTRPSALPRLFGGTVLVDGIDALAGYAASTGDAAGTWVSPADLIGPMLVDPVLQPFRVGLVAITGEGNVSGLRPVAMTFREAAPVPFTVLPGIPLSRESLPASTSAAPAPVKEPPPGGGRLR